MSHFVLMTKQRKNKNKLFPLNADLMLEYLKGIFDSAPSAAPCRLSDGLSQSSTPPSPLKLIHSHQFCARACLVIFSFLVKRHPGGSPTLFSDVRIIVKQQLHGCCEVLYTIALPCYGGLVWSWRKMMMRRRRWRRDGRWMRSAGHCVAVIAVIIVIIIVVVLLFNYYYY